MGRIAQCDGTFVFHKEYCLFLLPNLIYLGFQFIINYGILMESTDNINIEKNSILKLLLKKLDLDL